MSTFIACNVVWFHVYSTMVRLLAFTSAAVLRCVTVPPKSFTSCSMASSAKPATSVNTAWLPARMVSFSSGVAASSRSGMGAASSVTLFFTMPGALASASPNSSAASKLSKQTMLSSQAKAGARATSSSSTRPLVP